MSCQGCGTGVRAVQVSLELLYCTVELLVDHA